VRSRPLPIFVVEQPGLPSFAFEAAYEAQAMAFADAGWFTWALGDYLHSKPSGSSQQDFAPKIRPATKEETSVYQDFASEFADMTACFLLAQVS
jgi:hypothetical protein